MAITTAEKTPISLANLARNNDNMKEYIQGEIDKISVAGVIVDDALSNTSENPVQNKVITEALDEKVNSSDISMVATTGSYNDLTDKPTSMTPTAHTHAQSDITGLSTALSNKSDKNHKHTKSEITDFPTSLPASDVKAWAKADEKPTYTADEVGADASGSANTALANAKSYTDTKIADLINGAPSTLDTLGEIAEAMENNQSVVEALDTAIGTKANESDLTSHTTDSVKHITSTERTNWNAAKTHADSAHAPSNAQANVIETVKVNGTALTPSSKAVDITVPSVGNGTITITQNGTTKGTFTTNQSGNATIALDDNNTVYTHPTYTAKNSGLYKVTVDGTGHVSAATAVTKSDITALGIPASDTDTHYTTGLKVGSSSTATTNAAATNGNVYLNVLDNTTVRDSHKIVGSGATTVTSDANGVITISSTDTNTNTTYTAGTGLSLSGTTFNHSNSVTAGTAQGDASKTLAFGGTFTIPTVTYDAQGHITGKGTTTMTMPANPNTDTKVTNTLATTTKAYITGTTSSATNTGTQVFDTGVYLETTAGRLYASSFNENGTLLTNKYRYWRKALVGQTSNTGSDKPYYKFASLSTSTTNYDASITFKVSTCYGDSSTIVGILTAHFRTGSPAYWGIGELVWEYAASGVDTSKFILAHNTSASPTVVELWACVDESWRGYHFDVISEGTRNSTNNSLWSLYTTLTDGGEAAITDGYTQIASTLSTLKNPISGNASTATALTTSAGSATQPVYFSGGKPVATTYTLGASVPSGAKFTDTTYGVATSSALGLVKSGTDITVDSSGNVTVNDDSHNHVISNIDNLQTTLDSKLNKSGGTMTGALVAQSNTAYTTAQVRNVTISTSAPTGGSNGQIHYQYS